MLSNRTRPPTMRPGGALNQAHDRESSYALTATTLTDEADRLTRVNIERNAINGTDDTVCGVELGW